MPFKSKAQAAKFAELVKQGKISKETYNEWSKNTPSADKLPEKISSNKITSVDDLKKVAKLKKAKSV